jgi:hypothetical protein
MSIQPQQPPKKSKLSRIRDFVKAPDPTTRIDDAYGVMKEVGGFRPLFNVKDTEQRRKEILLAFTDLETKEDAIRTATNMTQKECLQREALHGAYKLAKLHNLFFATGSPWYRGRDNPELANAVSCYIQNFEDVGHLPECLPDLYAESMMLLHLSWQALDVTNTPGYIIQVNNVPTNGHQNLPYGYGPSQKSQNTEG